MRQQRAESPVTLVHRGDWVSLAGLAAERPEPRAEPNRPAQAPATDPGQAADGVGAAATVTVTVIMAWSRC